MGQRPAKSAKEKFKRQEQTGVVVSTGGDQTCTVAIDRLVRHPLYGKFLRRRTKLAVHDESNQAAMGDTVALTPCRPVSKRKRWRLVSVVKRATLVQQEASVRSDPPGAASAGTTRPPEGP